MPRVAITGTQAVTNSRGDGRNMATQSRTAGTPGDVSWLFLSVGILSLLALLGTGMSDDPAFRLQGYILLAAGVASLAALTIGIGNDRFRSDPSRYADAVIRAGVIATVFSSISSWLCAIYVEQIAPLGATYGSVGAVVVLLIWLSWNVNAIFYGGAFATEMEIAARSKDAPELPEAPEEAGSDRVVSLSARRASRPR